jgi:streptomycin 3"-adenylyltransferase
MQFGWHTAPIDTRAQVTALLHGLQRTLGDALRGVVLHGSLAQGSFNPLRSDVDVLAVCAHALDDDARRALDALLIDISLAPHPIEISIVRVDARPDWSHPAPFEYHFGEGWRARAAAGAGCPPGRDPDLAAHFAMAHARGIALLGPSPDSLLPNPPPHDVCDSILADVLSDEFGVPGLAAAARPSSVVLNACRALAFGRTGRLLSKDEGGLWALLELPWRQSSITARALEKYRSGSDEPQYSADEVRQFTGFILPALRNMRADR